MASETIQTIRRLTPLADMLAMIDAEANPVTPRPLSATAAAGKVLAHDAVAPTRPVSPLALSDGWAVIAEETLGAGGYAPVPLHSMPARVEAGQPMPHGTDSVAPPDAIKIVGRSAEALMEITPGDGVLPPGGDIDPSFPLLRAGKRLSLTHVATCAVAGIAHVTVRSPVLRIVPLRGNGIVTAAARAVAADISKRGGDAKLEDANSDFVLALAADGGDAIIGIGGTGAGRSDNAVQTLAREGRLRVHGVALTPGETVAFGFAERRPVLLLPGRLDAALAAWITIGRPLLQRLAGAEPESEPAETLSLLRKVTSTVGLTELVPVRRDGAQVEPLASKYLPLSALARSDGWIMIPAESEGYSAGATVQVRPWP